MAGAAALAAMTVVALMGAAGCSGPDSYVVLTLRSSQAAPITGVTEVVVSVMKGTALMKTLTYPAPSLTIDQVKTNTLSVSFTSSQVGSVAMSVRARNAAGCIVGTGDTSAVIKKGGRADATVSLDAANDCSQADGGAGDGGDAVSFPGCDPVTPNCSMATQTCQVNCVRRMGECVAGGTGAAGTICQRNADCMPGTQCFDYSGAGCNVKVCLRFCNNSGQCGGSGTAADGGAVSMPPSVCEGPVQCGGAATAYRTCTFSCDPRAAAAATGGGCPAGLACLVIGTMDQVDCGCPGATRTKTEGQDCANSTECAPGLICSLMSGSQKCRPVCRCNAQNGTCTGGPSTDCPTAGTRCVVLSNDTLYGICM